MDLHLRRSFGWGLLVLSDAGAGNVPESVPAGIAATETAVAIPVRHAQDVDFEGAAPEEEVAPCLVNVRMLAGPAPDGPLDFDGVLQVASGVLTIGDADHEDRLSFEAGQYHVQVRLDDARYAENVHVWIARGTVG